MPVSNPPFPYFEVQNSDLKLFSRGAIPLNDGEGKGFNIQAQDGYDAGTRTSGGTIYVNAGFGADSGTLNSYGGNLFLGAGNGGHVTGVNKNSYGGSVYIYSGKPQSDTYYSIAGRVNLRGGDANQIGSAGNNEGGQIYLKGGDVAHGQGYNKGGNLVFKGGSCLGEKVSDNAGDIYLIGGISTNYGRGGDIHLRLTTGVTRNGILLFDNLPTIDPGVAGAVWNSAGTLKIH